MKNPTILDVARLAGISTATVSRVINNSNSVKDETKAKVLQAIEALGYYPNFIARSLKNDETKVVGLLVSDLANSHFTAIAKEVERVIGEKGYSLIVCSTDEDGKRERNYLNVLMSQKIDGLILNTTGYNDAYIAQLSRELPMVLLSRKIADPEFVGDFVDMDNFAAGYALCRHLIDYGHKRIAVITGPMRLSAAKERAEGFCACMREAGLPIPPDYVFSGGFTQESGVEGAEHLMFLHYPPTAIVLTNNSLAMGAMRYFKQHGIAVPDQVSLAVFSNFDNEDLFYVQPSTFFNDSVKIGHAAAELVLERISAAERMPNRIKTFLSEITVQNGVRRLE